MGSSPRVWGQEYTGERHAGWARIIPTRVGTRQFSCTLNVIGRDHPHACGDKKIARLSDGVLKGSSPRVWGQDFLYKLFFCADRIIPTRVGTSRIIRGIKYLL